MTSQEHIHLRRRYMFGIGLGVILGIATMVIIGRLVPGEVSPATASNFFFASAGVNATLLVAISVTVPTIMAKIPGHKRRRRGLLLTAQLILVFFGLVVSGLGILYFDPSKPLDIEEFQEFVYLVFGTWVTSFVLLILGVWTAIPIGEQ
jgi:hypothetical protein